MPYHAQTNDDVDHILQVASMILQDGGESSLTMDRLALESGVSRSSLYRRFGNRDSLLRILASTHGLQIDQLALDPDIRKRILSATQTVLGNTGSLHFTMEQVADEAGLGVATLYRHFGTKEKLLEQTADLFHPRQLAKELLSHASNDIQADLEGFATQVIQYMQSQNEISRLIFSGDVHVQQLFRNNRSDQERTLTTLTRYLAEQIKAGRLKHHDPFNLAASFFGMLLGFAFIKPSYTQAKEDPQQIAKFIVQVFLNGVK